MFDHLRRWWGVSGSDFHPSLGRGTASNPQHRPPEERRHLAHLDSRDRDEQAACLGLRGGLWTQRLQLDQHSASPAERGRQGNRPETPVPNHRSHRSCGPLGSASQHIPFSAKPPWPGHVSSAFSVAWECTPLPWFSREHRLHILTWVTDSFSVCIGNPGGARAVHRIHDSQN